MGLYLYDFRSFVHDSKCFGAMRYLISTVLLIIVVVLTLMVGYCVFLGLTQHWTWLLVGLGVLLPDIVAVLTLSAAIPAAREY